MDIPKLSDKLFLDVDRSTDHSYVSINRSKGHLNELALFYIIEGYREATGLILSKIIQADSDWLKIDSLIYPLLFNFRHYLEVIIKDTLRYYRLYEKEIVSTKTGFVNEHSLVKLWQELKPYLKDTYNHIDTTETDLESVENLLIEFDNVDTGSYTFRYPFDGSRKPNGEIFFSIGALTVDLENIQNIIRKMQNFFEGVNWHIADILDNSLTLGND